MLQSIWKPPILSELTLIVLYMLLTHLDSEASIYIITGAMGLVELQHDTFFVKNNTPNKIVAEAKVLKSPIRQFHHKFKK